MVVLLLCQIEIKKKNSYCIWNGVQFLNLILTIYWSLIQQTKSVCVCVCVCVRMQHDLAILISKCL